eukprot:COSAG02_NODE_49017_length_329_cov_30.200000_1_plen_72_part_01
MLIEGSSGSSGGLVGEHQPDEPIARCAVVRAARARRTHGVVKPVYLRSDNGHSGAWPRFSDFRVILIHLSRL